ncbi:hypothetical protein POX_f07833 [Penicillium oxalicum]|nr:hypothetical protein POX_f07833 [Penicillium oxalicum]KAI2787468.1 hypothetical protein POX_f07833 [Penicillium oxalicum]
MSWQINEKDTGPETVCLRALEKTVHRPCGGILWSHHKLLARPNPIDLAMSTSTRMHSNRSPYQDSVLPYTTDGSSAPAFKKDLCPCQLIQSYPALCQERDTQQLYLGFCDQPIDHKRLQYRWPNFHLRRPVSYKSLCSRSRPQSYSSIP